MRVFHAEGTTGLESPPAVATYQAGGERLQIAEDIDLREAEFSREGFDLVIETPGSPPIVIEGYFAGSNPPALVSAAGHTFPPSLVQSFLHTPMQLADAGGRSAHADPVGSVQELTGEVRVTRTDGTVETAAIGTPIYQGDVIETGAQGAVNIVFIDETSFAVSDDARLAIDEYVFDPSTESGRQNFSVLKGIFVFTSGLIGRDDPDDVEIDTPMGSIGIRGTIIAGNVDTGEITVLEGAIVLRSFGGEEVTLVDQLDTARFDVASGSIERLGTLDTDTISEGFASLVPVAPGMFSSLPRTDTGTDNARTDDAQSVDDGPIDRSIESESKSESESESESSAAEGTNTAPQPNNELQDPAGQAQEQSAERLQRSTGDDRTDQAKQNSDFGSEAARGGPERGRDTGGSDEDNASGSIDRGTDTSLTPPPRPEPNDPPPPVTGAGVNDDSDDDTNADDSAAGDPPEDPQPDPAVRELTEADGAADLAAHQNGAILIGNSQNNEFRNAVFVDSLFPDGDEPAGFALIEGSGSNARFVFNDVSYEAGDGSDTILHTLNSTITNRISGIDGGTGYDVLRLQSNLSGGTATLDFSNVDALRGIEKIDMTGNPFPTTQRIILTSEMVFEAIGTADISYFSGTADSKRTLMIEGDTGDQLDLQLDSGEWSKVSNSPEEDSTGYARYEATDGATGEVHRLLVDTDLSNAGSLI